MTSEKPSHAGGYQNTLRDAANEHKKLDDMRPVSNVIPPAVIERLKTYSLAHPDKRNATEQAYFQSISKASGSDILKDEDGNVLYDATNSGATVSNDPGMTATQILSFGLFAFALMQILR